MPSDEGKVASCVPPLQRREATFRRDSPRRRQRRPGLSKTPAASPTAPASRPKTPYLCPNPPVFHVLDRLQKTELGLPENRLCIGCFKLAHYDGVLLIENGPTTHNMANLEPDALRVVLCDRQIAIDAWVQSSCSVTLTASATEMESARAYLVGQGISVYCVGVALLVMAKSYPQIL